MSDHVFGDCKGLGLHGLAAGFTIAVHLLPVRTRHVLLRRLIQRRECEDLEHGVEA